MNSYSLRYQFSLGEVQVHRQTTTLVLEQPDGSKAGGRVVCDLQQRVVEVADDRFHIEFEQTVVSREGTLGQQIPLQLVEGRSRCWIDSQGALHEHMQTELTPTPSLPAQAVSPGQLWTVRQPSPGGGSLVLQFQLEKVEQGVAHIVSHCQSNPGLSGEQAEIRGSLKFQLQPGGPLESTTVIATLYPDGRKAHQVIQLQRVS